MNKAETEYNKKVYSPRRINSAIKRYDELRRRLKELPFAEVDGSKDFRKLQDLQDYLVRAEVDLDSVGGLAGKIRRILRPSEQELRDYRLYEKLALERDIRHSRYLNVFQK